MPIHTSLHAAGVKILKAPKKTESTARVPFVPESKQALQQKKPTPKAAPKPTPVAKKPAPLKKVHDAVLVP
jgi:hypothetical protein